MRETELKVLGSLRLSFRELRFSWQPFGLLLLQSCPLSLQLGGFFSPRHHLPWHVIHTVDVRPHVHLQPSCPQSPASVPTDSSATLRGPASRSAGLPAFLPTCFLSQLASPHPTWLSTRVPVVLRTHQPLALPGPLPSWFPTLSQLLRRLFLVQQPSRRWPLSTPAHSSWTSCAPLLPSLLTAPVSPKAPSGLSRQESSCQVGGRESGKA